jgi:hypothetical protein
MTRSQMALILAVAVLTVAGLHAQDGHRTRVWISPVVVPAGSPQLEALATTVSGTIALSLRLLGDYEVVLDPGGATPDIAVEGSLVREADGAIRCRLEATQQLTGAVLAQADLLAPSLFDVFDVVDAAALELLEGISERSLSFATLSVVPDLVGYPYTLLLNGEVLVEANGPYRTDRLLEGRYELAVRQRRLIGEAEIALQDITLDPEAPLRIDLRIPELTDDEMHLTESLAPSRGRDMDALWSPSAETSALADLVGSGVVPAGAALVARHQSGLELERRLVDLWTGGSPADRSLVVRSLTITVDGVPAEWQKIPAITLDRVRGATEPSWGTVMLALSPDARRLHLLVAGPAGPTDRTDVVFRFQPVAERWREESATAIVLRASEATTAEVRQGSSPPVTVPARLSVANGVWEASIDVSDYALGEPFMARVDVTHADGPVAALPGGEIRVRPLLDQPPSRGYAATEALARFGSAFPDEAGGIPVAPGIGSFYRDAQSLIIDVEKAWRPVVSIVDDGSTPRLLFAVEGEPDADRITVTGPSGSGIEAVELEDDGRYDGEPGNGFYATRPIRAQNVQPGDRFDFLIEVGGFTVDVVAHVSGSTERATTGLSVRSSASGYHVSWDSPTDPDAYILIGNDAATLMPTPSGWRFVTTLPGEARETLIPRSRFGPDGMVRLHLIARDAAGNYVWSHEVFYNGPYFPDTRDVPVRSITIDGETADWHGLEPIYTDAASDDWRGNPGTPGPNITAAYMAIDRNHLYWRFDFADGAPGFEPGSICEWVIFGEPAGGGGQYFLEIRIQSGEGPPEPWVHVRWKNESVNRGVTQAPGVAYAVGDALVEAAFPLDAVLGEFVVRGASYRSEVRYWNHLRRSTLDRDYKGARIRFPVN